MALHTNLWRPDTCDHPPCEIFYSWDRDVPPDTRVHSLDHIGNRCEAHQSLPTDAAVYATVTAENSGLKNPVINKLAELETSLRDTQGGPDLNKITWRFNASRALEITLPTVTQGRKNQLKAALDTIHGVGKIVIS